jgi:hypothetical protein
MVKKAAGKGKAAKQTVLAGADHSPAIKVASVLDENHIRERAYGIWIEEGRPHGRDLTHWQRARQELQSEA